LRYVEAKERGGGAQKRAEKANGKRRGFENGARLLPDDAIQVNASTGVDTCISADFGRDVPRPSQSI
jgi:hypothetical protein